MNKFNDLIEKLIKINDLLQKEENSSIPLDSNIKEDKVKKSDDLDSKIAETMKRKIDEKWGGEAGKKIAEHSFEPSGLYFARLPSSRHDGVFEGPADRFRVGHRKKKVMVIYERGHDHGIKKGKQHDS